MQRRMPPSILVVDEDSRTHSTCIELFERSGFELRTATAGAEALEEVRLRPPDALITELALEGVDGLTLIHHARAVHPHMAIVVLTAEPSAASAARAIRLRVDDYVIKHADSVAHLRQTVRHALRRRARESEVERLLEELTELNEQFLANMAELQRANLELEERLRPPPAESEDGETWRVLVVDDDVAIAALLETLLRSQGFEVEGANSGAEARRLFRTRRFDLALMDKNLGDANGVELIREIHEVNPDTRVLLMTGYATLDSAVEALHHGAVGYLRKPFEDLGVVLGRVDEVLEQLREERARHRYLHAFRTRHADFLARYRLLKTKLVTLQKSRS